MKIIIWIKIVDLNIYYLRDIFYYWNICGWGIFCMFFKVLKFYFLSIELLWSIIVIYVLRNCRICEKGIYEKVLGKC